MCFAAILLDLVKCFERVPHEWLVKQGNRFGYPMAVLRLSLAAYRLGRVLVVDGICSGLVFALRGITAGAVHATVELRLLLIEFMDDTVAAFPMVVATLFVDDATIEATGSHDKVLCDTAGAAKFFTQALVEVGHEWSPTKNCIAASHLDLGRDIADRLPGLRLKVDNKAKSLGAALSAGTRRHAGILAARLTKFKLRKDRFRKLRRWAGAARTAAVMRTGGTAALSFGQANTGVADTMLAKQRSAVAMSLVTAGSANVDLTLLVADGTASGKADPAFEAHSAPIGTWAEAVWSQWLPAAAFRSIVNTAINKLADRPSPWAVVSGPGAAMVASARRLGWLVKSATAVTNDLGQDIDFVLDSPAFVKDAVNQAVRRWRARRTEEAMPFLRQGRGGFGLHIMPIYHLLNRKSSSSWTYKHKGALRSAFIGRQWPQVRLKQAGLAVCGACQLCSHGALPCRVRRPSLRWNLSAPHVDMPSHCPLQECQVPAVAPQGRPRQDCRRSAVPRRPRLVHSGHHAVAACAGR